MQLATIQDLYIHIHNETPRASEISHWAGLPGNEASELIKTFYRDVGRHSMYAGPEYGTPEYLALTEMGQLAADHGMLPGYGEDLGRLSA